MLRQIPHRNLITSLILLALVVPWIMTLLDEEPYPAVVLPAGANIISRNDSVFPVIRYDVLALSQGHYIPIPRQIFFHAIPNNMHYPLFYKLVLSIKANPKNQKALLTHAATELKTPIDTLCIVILEDHINIYSKDTLKCISLDSVFAYGS